MYTDYGLDFGGFDYNTPSYDYGLDFGGMDYSAPSYDYTYTPPSYNYGDGTMLTGGGSNFDFGTGGNGFTFGNGTSMTGEWWNPVGSGNGASSGTLGMGAFDPGSFAAAQGANFGVSLGIQGNSGATGAMGVAPQNENQQEQGTLLSPYASSGTGLRAPNTAPNSALNTQRPDGKSSFNWDKLAALGIEGAKLYTANQASNKADKFAGLEAQRLAQEQAYRQEQLNMQREAQAAQMSAYAAGRRMQEQAFASQQDAMRRNNTQADYWNGQATQSANEARSLYNPQELGLRGYSAATASSARAAQSAKESALKRGMSPAAAEAEARRARIAGSTGAASAYNSGLDTGRSASTGAMASASGLARQYGSVNSSGLSGSLPSAQVGSGSGYTNLADYYNTQGTNAAGNVGDILNMVLDYPGMTDAERLRAARQKGST